MSVDVIALDHLHIYAEDPERSTAFYMENFAASLFNRDHNSDGETRIFLALGQQVLVIGQFPSGITASQPPDAGRGAYVHGFGIAHFGLRVADVAAAAEQLRTNGVKIVTEEVQEGSGLSYVYVAAPDGVMVELTQY
jgi:catechol 2,3-dioxygenase-like lactoylglutathione lyase family enzyme